MPAVSEPTLPHTWRPLGVRLAMLFFGGLLVVVCVAGWFAVGSDVRSRVTVYQQLTLLLIAAMAGAVAWGLVRCRLTATDRGLVIVNGYRRHVYDWAEVLAVHLPSGAPFATLDLADGTTSLCLAIQSADGERARVAVRQLRLLLARTAAESLQRPDPPG
ncbi:MAG: PH domain-containing protein, partial [Nocardioides sp.]